MQKLAASSPDQPLARSPLPERVFALWGPRAAISSADDASRAAMQIDAAFRRNSNPRPFAHASDARGFDESALLATTIRAVAVLLVLQGLEHVQLARPSGR